MRHIYTYTIIIMDVTDIFWDCVHGMSTCDDVEQFRTTPEFDRMADCVTAAEQAGLPLTLARSSITEVGWGGAGEGEGEGKGQSLEFRNADDLFRGVLEILYKTEDRLRTQELQRCISIMESWGVLQDLCGSMQGHHI